MRIVEFAYDLHEGVKIVPINMVGKIDGLVIDNNGPMYRVVYWNNGIRYQQWVYSWEILRNI